MGYRVGMSTVPSTHDQDAEPPTPDGREPDQQQLADDEPASDPDPSNKG
jgi:hypothetical protein